MALVIDTDVLSYLYKKDTRAALYRPRLNNPPFIISFMTLAELRRWMRERNWGTARRHSLETCLTRYRVVFADDDLCEHWAQAMDSARRNGKPISPSDAWVAIWERFIFIPEITKKPESVPREASPSPSH